MLCQPFSISDVSLVLCRRIPSLIVPTSMTRSQETHVFPSHPTGESACKISLHTTLRSNPIALGLLSATPTVWNKITVMVQRLHQLLRVWPQQHPSWEPRRPPQHLVDPRPSRAGSALDVSRPATFCVFVTDRLPRSTVLQGARWRHLCWYR